MVCPLVYKKHLRFQMASLLKDQHSREKCVAALICDCLRQALTERGQALFVLLETGEGSMRSAAAAPPARSSSRGVEVSENFSESCGI